jgi:hypothetical protein
VTKSVSLGLTAEEYQSDPLIDLTVLMVCEDDNPPEYDTDSGNTVAPNELTSSCASLPSSR